MRLKVESFRGGDLHQRLIPFSPVALDHDFAPIVIGQWKLLAPERTRHNRNFVWIESHQVCASRVDARRIRSEKDYPGGDRIWIQGPSSLPGKDSIYQNVMPLAILTHRGTQGSIRVAVQNQLIQVEAHS